MDIKKEIAEWELLDSEIEKEMAEIGLPKIRKPKNEEFPEFPPDISTLTGHDITRLMGEYSAWAGYVRPLLAKVLARKGIEENLREKVYSRVVMENRAKEEKVSDAKSAAEVDSHIMALDKKIAKDEAKATHLRELLTTLDSYVKTLSRQLTLLAMDEDSEGKGDRRVIGKSKGDIYAG
jgi:hypothetical protein